MFFLLLRRRPLPPSVSRRTTETMTLTHTHTHMLTQVVFEEFGFASYYAAPAPSFSLRRMASLTPSLPGVSIVLCYVEGWMDE